MLPSGPTKGPNSTQESSPGDRKHAIARWKLREEWKSTCFWENRTNFLFGHIAIQGQWVFCWFTGRVSWASPSHQLKPSHVSQDKQKGKKVRPHLRPGETKSKAACASTHENMLRTQAGFFNNYSSILDTRLNGNEYIRSALQQQKKGNGAGCADSSRGNR